MTTADLRLAKNVMEANAKTPEPFVPILSDKQRAEVERAIAIGVANAILDSVEAAVGKFRGALKAELKAELKTEITKELKVKP